MMTYPDQLNKKQQLNAIKLCRGGLVVLCSLCLIACNDSSNDTADSKETSPLPAYQQQNNPPAAGLRFDQPPEAFKPLNEPEKKP